MKKKKSKLTGKTGFEQFYSAIYGARWEKLKAAFLSENQSAEYYVPGAEKSYFLDSASVLAALALPLKNAEKILDLCAAPGGKTVVLASRMSQNSTLFSNERSAQRKARLSVVAQTCLPSEISKRVTISCGDGATWCVRQSESFDRILLDAPCSSERHVFSDSKYLNEWSPSRIKTVAMQQWALLSSAYRLLRVNGIMVYSTCAICPAENDDAIEKLFKKFNKDGEHFKILPLSFDLDEISAFCKISLPSFEKTKYGFQILPDVQNGAGPIYFSIVKKLKSVENKK